MTGAFRRAFCCLLLPLGFCLGASDGDDALSSLLRECTGVYTALPEGVVTESYTRGPILGNGEIGVTVGGTPEQQTLYVNRVDFGCRALGGVTIAASKGTGAESYRYEQDIETAQVRSMVTLHGNATRMTTWVAADDPLVVCRLENVGKHPVAYTVQTWTKANGPDRPFHYRFSPHFTFVLREKDGRVVGGREGEPGALWVHEAAGRSGFHIRNVETGHYMYAAGEGGEILCGATDAPRTPEAVWYAVERGNSFANRKTGGRVVPNVKAGTVSLLDRSGRAVHWAADPVSGSFHPDQGGHEGECVWAYREWRFRGHFLARAVVATRILGAAVTRVAEGKATLTLKPHEAAFILSAVVGEGNLATDVAAVSVYRQRAMALVTGQTAESVRELDAGRLRWWRRFWEKSTVDLGDPRWHQFWYGSYYALACTSRSGHGAPGLWGAWVTYDQPRWGGTKYCNYNYMAPYYGVFSGNRAELALPYAEDMEWYLPHGRLRAQKAGYGGAMFPRTFGWKGWCGPAPEPIEPAPRKSGLPLQRDVTAFLAINLINHYFYTLDGDYLRRYAYPFIRAAADFYEDFMEFDGNRYTIRSGAREGTDDLNPAFALASIRFVLEAAVEASRDLDVDATRRDTWRHMIQHMSAYPTVTVQGTTLLTEAETYGRKRSNPVAMAGPGDNPVLLEIVHPAEGISLGSPERWKQIARDTIAYLNSNPKRLTWDNYCALPKIFTQAARVGWDADDLHRQIDRKIRRDMQPNLTVFPRWYGGGIEHAGMVEAVNSMLMQSHEGIIRLFPVWPRSRDARFTTLRAKYAFLVSAELRGGQVRGVRITSEKGRECTVLNPWPGRRVRLARDDKAAETLRGERVTFKTRAGETIALAPAK